MSGDQGEDADCSVGHTVGLNESNVGHSLSSGTSFLTDDDSLHRQVWGQPQLQSKVFDYICDHSHVQQVREDVKLGRNDWILGGKRLERGDNASASGNHGNVLGSAANSAHVCKPEWGKVHCGCWDVHWDLCTAVCT